MNLTNYSLLFFFSLIATCLLTHLLISYLASFGIVDVPGKRRAHSQITPRGGGLAIVIVVIIALSIFSYLNAVLFVDVLRIIPLLFLIAAVSFVDDLTTLPILVRLVTHLICATLVVVFFLFPYPLFHNGLPFYFDCILSVIILTTFVNIYNFLDGIDGITAVQSIHLSLTILLLCYLRPTVIINLNLIVTLSIIILACSIGFLIFNWHPARIFLGDVGSISLGLLIGLCLLLISASHINLFIASFIASLYYLADGGLTLLIRLINKEKIWQPHLKHFFQQAVKNGKTHTEVVHKIILCNLCLMVLSVMSLYLPVIALVLAMFCIMITLINFTKKPNEAPKR